MNRWSADINAESIQNVREFRERLKEKDYNRNLPPEAIEMLYQERIKRYIEINTLEKITYTRKGKVVKRTKPRRYTKKEIEFIQQNINKKTKEIYKTFPTPRTASSVYSKVYRLRKQT